MLQQRVSAIERQKTLLAFYEFRWLSVMNDEVKSKLRKLGCGEVSAESTGDGEGGEVGDGETAAWAAAVKNAKKRIKK